MAVQLQCLVQRSLLFLPGYDVAILILKCALVTITEFSAVRLRRPHHIAVGAWRYGLNVKDRVSASFRHQAMNNLGKPIAQ